MCGRYSLATEEANLRTRFGWSEQLELAPRFNIAPGQQALVVIAEDSVHPCLMRWGLIPIWAKDESISSRLINARAETLAAKPAFRTSFTRRRCLVLGDGFYEWARDGRVKQPVRIVMRDRQPFAFAGLWERWYPQDGQELRTFTIITTEPNELLRPIHNRMPVILSPADYDRWLDQRVTRPGDLQPLLRPYASEEMAFYPVDRLANDPRHDSPACIAPIPPRRRCDQPKVGHLVRVHHCAHSYSLPQGLEPGTMVRLLSWHPGGWMVEANGREWRISMTNVDPGEECFIAGEWIHESHPRAQEELARMPKYAGGGDASG